VEGVSQREVERRRGGHRGEAQQPEAERLPAVVDTRWGQQADETELPHHPRIRGTVQRDTASQGEVGLGRIET